MVTRRWAVHTSIVYRASVLTCIYTYTCFMAREKFRFEKQKSTHREGQSNDTDISTNFVDFHDLLSLFCLYHCV